MTARALRRVLLVVALLAAGYGVVVLVGNGGGTERTAGPVAEALRRAAEGRLDSVRLEGEETIVLRRRGDEWRVDGHRADTAMIGDLREALGRGSALELAARNPENHARMGVDSGGARSVVLGLADADPVRLLAGDRGPYRSSVYLRAPGSSSVYLARGQLGRLLGERRESWRDETIVALDTARAERIRVRRGDTTYALDRAGGGWRLGERSADSARVSRLLGELAGLAADGFAPDTAVVRPAERALTVLGPAAGGDTLVHLRLRRRSDEGPTRYLVAARGREAVFELRGPKAEGLTPSESEFRSPEEGRSPGPAPGEGGGGDDTED